MISTVVAFVPPTAIIEEALAQARVPVPTGGVGHRANPVAVVVVGLVALV
jgi:hypothetical protein